MNSQDSDQPLSDLPGAAAPTDDLAKPRRKRSAAAAVAVALALGVDVEAALAGLAAFSGGATPADMQAAVDALWQVASWPRVGLLLAGHA